MKYLFIFLTFIAHNCFSQIVDSTKKSNFSFEANISSTNVWLLNGVSYGLNEPNISLNVQYSSDILYAYAYKANSIVKPTSDGNYAMLAIGHKLNFKSNTILDLNVTSMFMQYNKFYQGYKASETQIYFATLVTQQILENKHYVSLQPVYVWFPGYSEIEQRSSNNFLLKADYEYHNKIGVFDFIYYYNNGIQSSNKSNAIGLNYLKRFDLSKNINGKVVVTAIKLLSDKDYSYLQNVVSVGYSIEL